MTRSVDPQTVSTSPAVRHTSPAVRWLAFGAIAGPVMFELAWFVLGFVSSGYTLFDHTFTHYSPISQPISGLGMGSTAPLMNTAFIVGGLLLIAGVVGVFQTTKGKGRPGLRRASVALLALTGLGQIADGIFNLEAILPHTLGFLLALGSPAVSFLVAGSYFRGIPQWRRFGNWLLLGSPLTLVLLVLFFMNFRPTADGAEHGVAGLVQRIGVIEAHAWFVGMGWLTLRRGQVVRPTGGRPLPENS
jgi:hypothetical membrane protein